jgi:hypothetical protein
MSVSFTRARRHCSPKTSPSVANDGKRVGGLKDPLYQTVSALASTQVRKAFHRDGWVFEEKVDGWRILAYKDGARVRLVTRNGRDHTRRFAAIVAAIAKLSARSVVPDGEVAIYDEQLRSCFEWLREPDADSVATPPVFMAFDPLHQDGREFTGRPLHDRRTRLGERRRWQRVRATGAPTRWEWLRGMGRGDGEGCSGQRGMRSRGSRRARGAQADVLSRSRERGPSPGSAYRDAPGAQRPDPLLLRIINTRRCALICPPMLSRSSRLHSSRAGWRVRSEVLTRQWRQVDFEANIVRLDPGTTKNLDGRTFAMTPELRDTLEAQHAVTEEKQRKTGSVIPWVFHWTKGGRPLKSFTGRHGNRHAWRRGVPGHILHDFRRMAVRNLQRAGVPRSVAMKMVGHKTESVYRRYAIVGEAMLRDAAIKLAERRGQSPGQMGYRSSSPCRVKDARNWSAGSDLSLGIHNGTEVFIFPVVMCGHVFLF